MWAHKREVDSELAPSLVILGAGRLAASAALVSVCVSGAYAQATAGQRAAEAVSLDENPRRARPPAWSIDVLDAFFSNAGDALVGSRPNYGRANSPAAGGRVAPGGVSAADGNATKWSALIDAETIETEIKRVAQAVAADVSSAGAFKGGGFQNSRRHFSQLAVLFGVTAEYDADARWQDVAAGLREAFSQAGRNAKTGSDQAFQEAVQRKRDLEELIRGARPAVPAAPARSRWSDVVDRAPLMQRLNAAQTERLNPWLANETEFARRRDEIRHEAEIVAMLAHVIGREAFDFWDDAEYAAHAEALQSAAGELSHAVEAGQFNDARRALDRANKACADCHDGYRG